MEQDLNRIFSMINDFVTGEINAEDFENSFTDMYDLGNLQFDASTKAYLDKIRNYLERYSFSQDDLRKFPDYFISSVQLKKIISNLKKEYHAM